ncbi:hypothetical protein JCM8202_003635 [Rhodotorula sphaerocarpa]
MTDDAHPKANDKSAVAADTAPAGSVLLTEEGELTDKFYALLATVFNRYATFPTSGGEDEGEDALVKAKTGSMGRPEMNAFAKATNGQDLPDEQWEELTTYLDVNADTELTFKGFTALYSLQTENDEAETVKDLEHWGYDPVTLEPVAKSAASAEEVSGSKAETAAP